MVCLFGYVGLVRGQREVVATAAEFGYGVEFGIYLAVKRWFVKCSKPKRSRIYKRNVCKPIIIPIPSLTIALTTKYMISYSAVY